MERRTNRAAWVLVAAVAMGAGGRAAWGQSGAGNPTFVDPPVKQPGRTAKPEVPTGADRGARVDLRPKWEKGAVTRYTLHSLVDTGGQGKKADPEANSKADIEFTLKLRVLDSDPEKGAHVEMTFERIKAKISAAGQDMTYDSQGAKPGPTAPGKAPAAKPPAPDDIDALMGDTLGQVFGPILGTKMTVTFDEKGNIKSVEGGGALGAAAQMGAPNLGSTSGNIFGPIDTRSGAPGMAAVGDMWTTDDVVNVGPLGGDLRMKTQYKVRDASAGEAHVTFTGQLAPLSDGGGAGGAAVRDATYTGQYTWDTRLGQLAKMSSEQTVSVDLTGNGSATLARQTVTVDRVK